MGKIFGISNLPVSTIESALDGRYYKPIKRVAKSVNTGFSDSVDTFVSKDKKEISNPIIKMRNGFGKLMSHFSKPKSKVG